MDTRGIRAKECPIFFEGGGRKSSGGASRVGQPDLFSKFTVIIYTDPTNAVFKTLGVE
jgi:predicted ATP-dependent Lon-type protease